MMIAMIALRIAGFLLTAYLTIGGFFYFQQTRILFPAPQTWPKNTPADLGVVFYDLHIQGVHAWWIPHSRAAGTAIVFHGNGYVMEEMVGPELAFLRKLGLNLLLVDYRGYGESEKITPNESSVLEDADTSFDYLIRTRHIPPEEIFVIGRSIGSGPAVYLASKHSDLAGLILESPFSSVDEAAQVLPYLRIYPVTSMLHSHFDNAGRIGAVKAPVFIAVGAVDELTPPSMAQKLLAKTNAAKKLLIVPGTGHNDLIETGGIELKEALLTYLSGKVKR